MNRIIVSIALLLILPGFNLAQTAQRRAPVSKPETANQVDGSFSFGGKATRVSHAHLTVIFAKHQDEVREDQIRLIKGIIRK